MTFPPDTVLRLKTGERFIVGEDSGKALSGWIEELVPRGSTASGHPILRAVHHECEIPRCLVASEIERLEVAS